MAIVKPTCMHVCAFLVLLAALFVFPVTASAEDTPAADPAAAAPAATPAATPAADAGGSATNAAAASTSNVPQGVWQMILQASGTFGFTIIFLSVVSLFLAIQAFMDTKGDKLMPPDVLEEIEQALDEGNYEAALEVCQQNDTFMTRIIGAGLGKMAYGFDRMVEAIGDEADAQTTLLHQKIGYINLIAAMAPMLGLLGTVSGMITAFGMIATNPAANPGDLAVGIYCALVTTIEGLCVAIPCTLIFTLLRNHVIKVVFNQGTINGEILDRFRNAE